MSYLRTVLFAALVLCAACGGGNNYQSPTQPTPQPAPAPAPAPPPSGGGTAVTIGQGATSQGNNAFGMNPLTVTVGTRVTWTNNDTVTHTATSNSSGVFDTGNIPPGGNASVTFNTAGTIPYHCTIHPGMMGAIVVQ